MPPSHGAKKNSFDKSKSPGSRAYSLTHDSAGNTIDNLNAPADKTTRRYIGSRKGMGTWQNANGVQLGRSASEDSDFMPQKSTGDIPPTHGLAAAIHIHLHSDPSDINYGKAAKLKNKKYKGKAGY